MYGAEEKLMKNFGWKTEGKRALGRGSSRWDDNIKMDLLDI
jgi:hypothetical protein